VGVAQAVTPEIPMSRVSGRALIDLCAGGRAFGFFLDWQGRSHSTEHDGVLLGTRSSIPDNLFGS
jgi:hypothetical protein